MTQAEQYRQLVEARRKAVQAEIDYLKANQQDNDYENWDIDAKGYPDVIFKDGSKCQL